MTTPATPAPDFVSLRLTAAGLAFAGKSGQLRMSNGHYDYTFTATTPVRVLSSEWRRGFPVKTFNSQPVLEEVAPSLPMPAPARLIDSAASISDTPAQSTGVQPAAKAAKAPANIEVK